jgi:pilus assembly protein Flp/PilA
MITQFNVLKTWIQTLAKTERGASLVEYALLVALIAVVVIGAITLLGGAAEDTFSGVADSITNA